MPPKIALLLCIIFILYLFKLDFKLKSDVSHALWIPLIWLMISGSRLPSQWLNLNANVGQATVYMQGNPFDRVIFSILIVAGLFILSRRKINWSLILHSNRWIFLLFLYFGISILWSDFPFVSFKRWIKGIGVLIMILIVLTDPEPVEAIKTLIRRCAYVLIPLSIVFIKYYPDLGRAYDPWTGIPYYQGVTTSKNMLGQLCLVLGFFLFWSMLTMWRKRDLSFDKKEMFINLLFFAMILWVLNKANSATSLMCLIVGISFLIVIKIPLIRKNVDSIGIYLLIAVIAYWILESTFGITRLIIESLGRNITLTDRTYIWKELLGMGTNPLIGVGYESFWLGDRLTRIWADRSINEAHNGYLEVYLNLGLIGLFLFLMVIVVAYRISKRELILDFDYGRFKMGLLVVSLFYNITEAGFRGLSLIWFSFLLIAIDCPRPITDPKLQQPP